MSSGCLGSGAILRIAGLPLAAYAAGGNPELFDELYELSTGLSQYRQLASSVAADLGDILVPCPGLTGGERAEVLSLRRALHQGQTGAASTSGRVGSLAARMVPRSGLAARLAEVTELATRLSRSQARAEATVAAESCRLAGLPWQVLHSSPAARCALASGDLPVYADITARLAAGEPWTSKRMRQRADYLWRMLARASARATPRGWLAHVCAVTVADQGWGPGQEMPVADRAAVETADNFDNARCRSGDLNSAVPGETGVTVSRAPMTWHEPEHIAVWQLGGDQHRRLARVRLRRTGALTAIWDLLADGPKPADRLVTDLAGSDPVRASTVTKFLTHLVSAGVLQSASPPRITRAGWAPVSGRGEPPAVAAAGSGYCDVYRQATVPLAEAHAVALASAASLAMRVMAGPGGAGPPDPARIPAAITELPRPLLDVVADCVTDDDERTWQQHRHDWPAPAGATPGYRAMHEWLTAQLPPGSRGDAIDIAPALLDAWEFPEQDPTWPADVLMRPIAQGLGRPLAALAAIAPAGVLDARFLPALTSFGSPLPQAAAYRRFLSRLSELTGIRLVEVLVPPLSERAANAVRRPGYTRWWTGDPDLSGYFDPDQNAPEQYLPLTAITVRRDAHGVLAETGGSPIWPLLHTARAAGPVWDVICALLSSASPQASRNLWRPLLNSLPAWPDRDQMPRITVGGQVVLTAAQWRLRPGELGSPDDRLADRARAQATLRRSRGIPRWVTVTAAAYDDPVTVDLDSLQALRMLDRLGAQRQALTLMELIPGPDQLPVRDLADPGPSGHCAELLLRLPYAVMPEAAAATVAARFASSRPRAGITAGTSGSSLSAPITEGVIHGANARTGTR